MKLNRNSKIASDIISVPIHKAMGNLRRDIFKSCLISEESGAVIRLLKGSQEREGYLLKTEEGELRLTAGDELGFIYGLYEISRRILGIQAFWFWNDQKIEPKPFYEIPENFRIQSSPWAVRFRGWFVNDEVLLHTWQVNCRKEEPWEMVFEALLRCGGNMVIPGTDSNSKKYKATASSMGLYITHHHAEPLGAEMFARAYPDLNPSYEEHPEKFQELWRRGIESQKQDKVVWNIGFRGQGDCPFWSSDPRYDTPQSRGELMSRLIRFQYDMVKEQNENAVCCTNLYGETMELYRDGYLNLPEDVIKIWADNGYGKMVSRRQENHNPRVPALPKEQDKGCHGIYYHVSFYDLQAANHMTMLPNSPEFVLKELQTVLHKGVKDYWIINCSNVKPHVYYLDFLSRLWKDADVDIEKHREEYVKQYFTQEQDKVKEIAQCLGDYFKASVSYGPHEDDHAGEQYTNHVPRMLITQFMRDRNKQAEDLLWMYQGETLKEQIAHYKEICKKGKESYGTYLRQCEKTRADLTGRERILFEDSLHLQARIHALCYRGALFICECLEHAYEEKYQEAFYLAGKARKDFVAANQVMRDREHGKWHRFYENECLTDIKQTGWVLKALMAYLRNLGEGPHYYQWQRDFLYSKEDRKVMLIMNMENHLEDLELFELMEAAGTCCAGCDLL